MSEFRNSPARRHTHPSGAGRRFPGQTAVVAYGQAAGVWVNVGARIRHSTFGEGVVAWKGMVKRGPAVKIDFDLIGEKWLDPETADRFVTMTSRPVDPEGPGSN